jgi:RecB family endonuclease NucS
MPEEVRLWKVEAGDTLRELTRTQLDLEARLEIWLERDMSILSPDLLVISRQVATDFGGLLDLLCLNRTGDVIVVELKRDRTPRDITAQILDYGSWVKSLSYEQIVALAKGYLGPRGQGSLDEAFEGH